MWVVYSGDLRGEVGARSRMCYVGWLVCVQGVLYSNISFLLNINKIPKNSDTRKQHDFL